VSIVTADATIKIPMAELVDIEAEKARLNKEKDAVQKQLDSVMSRLNNKAFTDKAPAAVVESNRQTADRLREQLHLLDESLQQLG
jgi:valyl-tRNA synthetase